MTSKTKYKRLNQTPMDMARLTTTTTSSEDQVYEDFYAISTDRGNNPGGNDKFKTCFNSVCKHRHIISFWFFGLCNNFAYVVMLSAAHDILHDNGQDNNTNHNHHYHNNITTDQSHPNSTNSNNLVCNTIGTGAILLADILPTLIVKLIFPFFLQQIPYHVKISLVAIFSASSFIIVAFAHELWLSIVGVVSASVGAGLGEITFLSLTTFYHRDVVSSWSSGTGGAGVFGAVVYAGFTSLGLSPRVSLLIMLIVPVLMVIIYIIVLPPVTFDINKKAEDDETNILIRDTNILTYKQKFRLVPSLFKYMIPLSLVYFAEYFINQGLHELLYFKGEFISRKEQYRWFQVDYQIGVFISRSSVNFFQIKKLWILPLLQFANMALLICQVYFRFIPNLWIIMAIILWEGLLGGAAYVNTFYRMTNDLSSHIKEFCIGVATLGDSIGVALAGTAAIPFHNHICDLNLKI